jgi:hypothetical protein
MKVAILNDTHCGVRNSSDHFIKYQEEFYDSVFFPYLIKHDIKKILHLGDYYESRKGINFRALHSNRKHFLEPLVNYGMSMDIIPGNHDLYYNNTSEICSLKELLGFFIKNIRIYMSPEVIQYDKTSVAMLPWINDGNKNDSMSFIDHCDRKTILAAHLQLKGFEMYRGTTSSDGMEPELFSKFNRVLTGHFHTKSCRDNIYYLGSQMEFTWADAGDIKFFHILDTDNNEIMPVMNPIIMHHTIYYDDSAKNHEEIIQKFDYSFLEKKYIKVIVISKKDPYLFDKFIDSIQQRVMNIYELKIIDSLFEFTDKNGIIQHSGSDLHSLSDTKQILNDYVEVIETSLSKDKIKEVLQNTYIKALASD